MTNKTAGDNPAKLIKGCLLGSALGIVVSAAAIWVFSDAKDTRVITASTTREYLIDDVRRMGEQSVVILARDVKTGKRLTQTHGTDDCFPGIMSLVIGETVTATAHLLEDKNAYEVVVDFPALCSSIAIDSANADKSIFKEEKKMNYSKIL